jgi:hypothetical protein
MKRTIKLTESDLHNIVRRCVNEVIAEGQGWDAVKDIWRRRGDWMNDPSTYDDQEFNQGLDNWVNTGSYDIKNGEQKAKSYKEDEPTVGFDSIEPNEEMGLKKTNQSLRGRIGRSAAGAAIKGMYNYGKARNAIKNGFGKAKRAAWQS